MIDRLVHQAEVASLRADFYRLKDRDLGRPTNAANDDQRPTGGQFSVAIDTAANCVIEWHRVARSSAARESSVIGAAVCPMCAPAVQPGRARCCNLHVNHAMLAPEQIDAMPSQ
jgi:hypothetical protein